MQDTAALKPLFTLSGAWRGSGEGLAWIDAAQCSEKVWERQQMAPGTLAALQP